jgi:hypothetical protein
LEKSPGVPGLGGWDAGLRGFEAAGGRESAWKPILLERAGAGNPSAL